MLVTQKAGYPNIKVTYITALATHFLHSGCKSREANSGSKSMRCLIE